MGQGGSGLAAKVSGPQAVLDWLSGIRIAHSAAEAEAVAAQLAPGESVLTADGLWRGRHWVRYAKRGEEGNSGVIARGQLPKQPQAHVEGQPTPVLDRERATGEPAP